MSATQHSQHIELSISGMTCASCAARIERKLNKLDGVSASVNYATAKASVDYEPELAQPRGPAQRGASGRLPGGPARGRA